jgi:cytochrome c
MRAAGVALAVALAGVTTTGSAAPDAARGEALYARCMACQDRVGPRHCGLFGRTSGSVRGFEYSPAMQKARIVWNEQTLDRFLASPLREVPGTSMTYDGVTDATERADLIAYLKQANQSPECPSKAAAR